MWEVKGRCRSGFGLLRTDAAGLSTSVPSTGPSDVYTVLTPLRSLQDPGECCFLGDPRWSLLPPAPVTVLVRMGFVEGRVGRR